MTQKRSKGVTETAKIYQRKNREVSLKVKIRKGPRASERVVCEYLTRQSMMKINQAAKYCSQIDGKRRSSKSLPILIKKNSNRNHAHLGISLEWKISPNSHLR